MGTWLFDGDKCVATCYNVFQQIDSLMGTRTAMCCICVGCDLKTQLGVIHTESSYSDLKMSYAEFFKFLNEYDSQV